MKFHKIIILIVMLVSSVGVVLLVRHTGAQELNQQAYDVACEVRDPVSLQECVRKAKNGEYNLIKIMNIIECRSKEECAVDLSDIEQEIILYGISNTDTGFKRIGNFDYSLFTVKNAKNITMGSFVIDDSDLGDCAASGLPCPPAVVLENVSNSIIDQLHSISAKTAAVSIAGSKSIVVKNSLFENDNQSVVVTNGSKFSSDITIEKNVFKQSQSNALVFSASGGGTSIKNNVFQHNHTQSDYSGCVGICNAAQVRIMPDTKNILIDHNSIRDGIIETYNAFGLYASGIEIAGTGVRDVTMTCNEIVNNTGNGIVIPERDASTTQIILQKNAIYNNGINLNYITDPQDNIENNCSSSGCTIAGC